MRTLEITNITYNIVPQRENKYLSIPDESIDSYNLNGDQFSNLLNLIIQIYVDLTNSCQEIHPTKIFTCMK